MAKYHVKRGDQVVVHTGKWKGEKATITAVLTKSDRVVLEFSALSDEKRKAIGMRTVKKSRRNSETGGGMIERSVSVHVSNVAKLEQQGE